MTGSAMTGSAMRAGEVRLWDAERLYDMAPWIVALAVGCWLLYRLWRAAPLRGQRRTVVSFVHREDSGTGMLDFLLVFPIFMMIVLIIVQLLMLLNARILVGYAAYTAARSAAVNLDDGATFRYERAAALACMPISPDFGRVPSLLQAYLIGRNGGNLGLFVTFSTLPFEWSLFAHTPDSSRYARRLPGKLRYAALATEVQVSQADSAGPRDPFTLEVTHRYYLDVPYSGEIFARLMGGFEGSFFGPFITLSDRFTLLAEGQYAHSR